MEKIIILCPGHDVNDQRVNRTNSILIKKYNIKVFYELKYKLTDEPQIENIFYLKNKFAYFKVKSIIKSITENTDKPISVYIHDSGLLGILLCWWWSKFNIVKSITFDYHDWIPWEVYYQVKKRIKNPILLKASYRSLLWFSRICFKSLKIKNLVGISSEQLEALKRDFNLNDTRDLVVPNTRKKILERKKVYGTEFHGVLWVGNVMRGRDLDILNTFVVKYNKLNNSSINLFIIGNVYDEEYLKSLELKSTIKYLRPFNSDLEILELIQNYNVAGFFYGWDDIMNTGINKIASPNKAYTYLNLGVPTIMGSHLESLKLSVANDDDSVFWIEDYAGFEKAINFISRNYNSIIKNFNVKTKWEGDIIKKIEDFF
ncbi:hypothetical protein [Xanthomarina gelatinilytica]|uniref:hypothetical protein n=1 Tax=Xanthomarina gelatinilytica TaxID=1137281 RepID=UPI003AA92558